MDFELLLSSEETLIVSLFAAFASIEVFNSLSCFNLKLITSQQEVLSVLETKLISLLRLFLDFKSICVFIGAFLE